MHGKGYEGLGHYLGLTGVLGCLGWVWHGKPSLAYKTRLSVKRLYLSL